MEKCTHLILDYGGVIGRTPNSEAIDILSERLSLAKDRVRNTVSNNSRHLQEIHLPEHLFWQTFSRGLPGCTVDDFKNIWVNNIQKSATIDMNVITYLEQMRNEYTLTLLSNTSQIYMYSPFNPILERVFDTIIYSCDVGFKKPNKEIYDYALRVILAKPHTCIIIDDEAENLLYPSTIGMHTILFTSLQDLQNKLIQLPATI